MAYSYICIIFIALFFCATGRRMKVCPSEESIAPHCTCKNLGSGPMMLCNNIMSPEELTPPIKATDPLDMFSLAIIDSSLTYIPSKLFIGNNYAKIRFANSQVMALSDSDLAFEGLEDTLEEIRASGAQYITTWDWASLREHRKLNLIDIYEISMYSLDQKLPSWPNLRHLGIGKAEISFIHPEAFSELKNLVIINLSHNEITDMKREMFSKPAENLYHIDLSHNLIESLPDDMFTEMSNLKELHLKNNKLFTLKEEAYQWTFENLQTLDLTGNEIRCDCRLGWMVNTRKPHRFEGTCVAPYNLKDVPLRQINSKVLFC